MAVEERSSIKARPECVRAEMDSSEYRAKLTMAIVCYAALLIIVAFFLSNLITQGLDSGWPHSEKNPAAGRYVVDFLVIFAVFWGLFQSVNALYVRSRGLFLELGFEFKRGLTLLQRDMRWMGRNSGSAVRKTRDYYWLSIVFVVVCVLSLFSLSFFPPWIAFIVMTGFLNIFGRRI
ncbi:MAG TPA: hypothetical protein DCF45_12110 [Gammaproteobacteria bacterium]|nr:hypothetical protein [Gammaproteobacteria bacterium]